MMALARLLLGAFKGVPRWVWILLALAAAWRFGVDRHQAAINRLVKEADAAGYARAVADGKRGVKVIEAKGENISADERKKADDAINASAGHAAALRVRGPGAAAACVGSQISALSGRRRAHGGGVDAGLDRPADRAQDGEALTIVVPFLEFVDRAEVADANRTEALACRSWHARLTAEWTAYQAQLDGQDVKR